MDSKGRKFVNRPSKEFEIILTCLRMKENFAGIGLDEKDHQNLLFELEFYGINEDLSKNVDVEEKDEDDEDSKFQIIEASYGADSTFADVKTKLADYFKKNQKKGFVKFTGDFNSIFTDPIEGVAKELKVKYQVKGKKYEETLKEGEKATFPNMKKK